MQLDDFYTVGSNSFFTGHEVTVNDYYETDDSLNVDQNTDKDISAYNYVENKHYFIDIIRITGSNSNEDWNGANNQYSLTQVCFYTSDQIFSIDNWNSHLKQCYFFEIDNYVSTFKGVFLKSFYLNGYVTGIYGWIDGPYVTDNVYFYHTAPLFSYTEDAAFAIEFGTTSGDHGQDFHVFSPIASESGDYYGNEITNIKKDTEQPGGFENGGLTATFWNADPSAQIAEYGYTALKTTFSRNISTHDNYDRKLKSTFIFCLYLFAEGTINSDLTDKECEIVELSYHYPRMEMPIKVSW